MDVVASGWGRGAWAELHSVYRHPESGEFTRPPQSPWSEWAVHRVAPGTVEYTTSDGTTSRVLFEEGRYLDFGPVAEDGSVGEPTVAEIVEARVDAPDNWRVLILWPPLPDTPTGVRDFSELIVVGDLFIWTNWVGPDLESAARTMYSVSRLAN